ncbi:MAG: PAS domain S-box protein [Crocinitomicaceae bacterium]|nr:PAS domain S-box protein [Crocinitomicaceae bacterium]
MKEVELLKRKLARERASRKEAERILEEKALELFNANAELMAIRDSQELELKKRIAEIKDQEKTYRNLIENASDIIYTCDVKGYITYVNPMMVNLFGFSEEELIGAHFERFVSPSYRNRVQGFYAFQFEEKLQSTYTEFPIIDAKGNEVWIGQTVDISIKEEITFSALARDISDRKKVEKSLMLSEEKYKSIIENMELGLLEVSKEGKIIRAYPKFLALTGYTNEELVGKDPVDYFLSEEEAEKMQQRNNDRLNGESEVYEVKLKRKDGSEIWVLISGAPYYNERGIVEGSVGIHLDISRQKRMEDELRNAKRIAEDSLKSKDLFLANISHEIRTPLNAIIGISELMLDSMLSKTQKKYLETIMASGDNLLGLINEILDLSTIESGKLKLRNEPVDLAMLMEHIHRSFSVIGGKKNIPVHLNSELEENQFHLTDPMRLKEVLFNLVGNAVKFTALGSVTIDVSHLGSSESHDTYLFKIVDTGVGIPKEELKDVFKMFTQASNTFAGSESGTGLGLSISNGIIENMGGDLTVTSELGKGACFQFSLDFERSENGNSKEHVSAKSEEKRSLKDRRILVVEDAEINRFLVNTILNKWGVVVKESVNGQEAVETLRNDSFDLVLMDVRMPVMDGLEATRIIRSEKNDVPIIALTANAIGGEVDKCKSAGMNDYLSKPYSQDELYAVLTKFIGPDSDRRNSLVNLKGIDNITGGDMTFQIRMISLFKEETMLNIEILQDAIEKKDEASIVRVAHTMKAAAAHICTDSIVELLRNIEMDDVPFEKRTQTVLDLIPLLNDLMIELDAKFS